MEKDSYYKEKEITKIINSNYFNKETLISIRKDLEMFNEEEFKEKKKKIRKNSKAITQIIPEKEITDYFKLALSIT